jgi:hypothetical protein
VEARRRIPIQTIPVRTIPIQTIPVQTIPVQTIPVRTIPVRTIPVQTIPIAGTGAATLTAGVHRKAIADLRARKARALPTTPSARSRYC